MQERIFLSSNPHFQKENLPIVMADEAGLKTPDSKQTETPSLVLAIQGHTGKMTYFDDSQDS
jgi:hypothetical protein